MDLENSRIALLTGSLPPHDVCGVGDYTKRLFDELVKLIPVEMVRLPIERSFEPELLRVFRGRDLVHVQYPTEGWGKSLLPSLLPLGRRIYSPNTRLVITLHEWSQMNPIRRKSILPLVAGADAFVFVTPFERDSFLETAPARARTRPNFVIPIGVNLTVPAVPAAEILAFRENEREGTFDVLLTHFGFIHEGKQPGKLLDLLTELKGMGSRPRMLFIGGFQKDKPAEQAAFERTIAERGLTENVKLTGFIDDDRLAALYMASGDANVSLFAEGLSSRRGSFWYAAQHGTPLITTSPRDPREFTRVAAELTAPHVTFVPTDVSGAGLAKAVLALPPYRAFRYPAIPPEDWADIARAHVDMYRAL